MNSGSGVYGAVKTLVREWDGRGENGESSKQLDKKDGVTNYHETIGMNLTLK